MLILLITCAYVTSFAEVTRLRARSSVGAVALQAPWEDIPVEKPKDFQKCGPNCRYECAQPECSTEQQWEPLCDPPECVTTCSSARDHCETRCGEPLCAVVCPQSECKGSDCSSAVKCQTVCNPPVCTTSCSDSCQTSCATPTCKWRCKSNPSCPPPSCKLSCTDLDCPASLHARQNTTASRQLQDSLTKQGKVLVAEGRASLDPHILAKGPLAPAPAPAAVQAQAPLAAAPAAAPAAVPAAVPAAAPVAAAEVGPAQLWRTDLSWLWDALKAPEVSR
mmetsp:Transcript_22288/g.51600  ORF Transcript_22288/g.51600 Transcript_22288/m.51600 type:complete len:278 (+) Transcript_22288:99-932(+)